MLFYLNKPIKENGFLWSKETYRAKYKFEAFANTVIRQNC